MTWCHRFNTPKIISDGHIAIYVEVIRAGVGEDVGAAAGGVQGHRSLVSGCADGDVAGDGRVAAASHEMRRSHFHSRQSLCRCQNLSL